MACRSRWLKAGSRLRLFGASSTLRRTVWVGNAIYRLKFHPLGKSPVIQDGDLVLAESGAIIEYLLERHGNGRLVPARGTNEHVRYLHWMHFAEGTIMPLPLARRRWC
jgi:glutathione S-transferase